MQSFYILLILLIISVVFGLIEFARHQKRIYQIPLRIHINGTRGKSSVTRLIGAGLRAGGISTITKVTGTFPRLIMEDGSEVQIYRKSSANIIEQLSIAKYAASRKVEALVIECMALQPQYQHITENQMIHANIGVMTNVRLDHVDVMGHTVHEIADTLGKTIPKKQILFTAEHQIAGKLKALAKKKKTRIHFSTEGNITAQDMGGFSYIEHPENVALALDVCAQAGVDRETALKGMHAAIPDAGVLSCYRVESFKKEIKFYNAFAANDPESTMMIWRLLGKNGGLTGTKIVLLNTRHDRMDRARQLSEMLGKQLNTEMDYTILMGESTDVVEKMVIQYGVSQERIINLGWTEPADIFESVLQVTNSTATILAVGNMGGKGAETAEYFEHRSL